MGKSSLLRPLEEEESDYDEDDEEDESAVSSARSTTTTSSSSGKLGGMFSVFRGLVGNKALTKVHMTEIKLIYSFRIYRIPRLFCLFWSAENSSCARYRYTLSIRYSCSGTGTFFKTEIRLA